MIEAAAEGRRTSMSRVKTGQAETTTAQREDQTQREDQQVRPQQQEQ
jgi:hypothetical protein